MARQFRKESGERVIPSAKPFVGEEEVKAIREVIRSGWLVQGPKVLAFENAFADYVGSKHACAVSNCTTGLHLALLTVGVKPGDAVITVSHSFIATANSIRYCNAHPVFVDIDLDTYNMSVAKLKECLEKECRTKNRKIFYKGRQIEKLARVAAILVVHQMGMPCDLENILKLAKHYKIPVIEDAACAIGSKIKINGRWDLIGKPHADVACFSFHPLKVLTTGEGGMLTTNNPKYDKNFRLLRHQGMSVSDLKRHTSKKLIIEEYPVVGYNYRMTDMQAAMGLVQLKKLLAVVKRRRDIVEQYRKHLSEIPWLQLPVEPDYAESNWQSFAVRLLENAPLSRNQLVQKLRDHKILARIGIMNAHKEKPYLDRCTRLVNSEIARNTVLLLPLFYTMTKVQQGKIISLIKDS